MSKKSPKKKAKVIKVKASQGKNWDRMLNVKVTAGEYAAMHSMARKFAGANLSRWIRYAGTQLKPRKAIPARA